MPTNASVVSADHRGHQVVTFPSAVRTKRQRIMWLLKKGYVLTAYLLATHANKALVMLLKKTNPNVPWSNIQAAARYS